MGAGDQGMMFGYATDETKEMLPLPYVLACEALERLRDCGAPCLRPDAKCQVTFDYGRHRIDTFLISTQHTEDASSEDVYNIVLQVMKDTAKRYGLNTFSEYFLQFVCILSTELKSSVVNSPVSDR